MSLLDSLYDAQTWEEYKQYKISHGHISPRRQKELEEYIRCELYLPNAKKACDIYVPAAADQGAQASYVPFV